MEVENIEVKKKEEKKIENSKDLTSNKKEKDKESKTEDFKKEYSENNSEYHQHDNYTNDSNIMSGDASFQNSDKKSNKSNSHPANPPSKDDQKSADPMRKKGKKKKKKKNKNKEKNEEKNEDNKKNKKTCGCKTYEEYIYSINKELKNNKCCCCGGGCCCGGCCNNDDDSNYGCWDIFLAKTISENTLLFTFYDLFSRTVDKNGYFIRFTVLVLYIGWYMFFNLITETNSSDLHFYLDKDENSQKNFFSWLKNAIFPYFFVYLMVRYLKKTLSLREFYLDIKKKILPLIKKLIKKKKDKKEEKKKKKYLKKRGIRRDSEEMKKIEKKLEKIEKNLEKLTIELHNIRTTIKKFKNNLNNGLKIIMTIGFVVLFCNAVLSYCYFGIYHNSFWCVFVNVLTSIGYNIVISLVINALESIFKCGFKQTLFFLYMPLCCFSYFILNKVCCKKEEFNILIEDEKDLSDDDGDNDNSRVRLEVGINF